MSPSSRHSSRTPSSRPAPSGGTTLLIRLVVASIIFAVSLILRIPELVSTILLIVSAAVAGYDVVLDSVHCIQNGDYFATPIAVVFVAALSFMIGFGTEGAALMILYQIGLILIAYASERTKKSAQELLQYSDEETVQLVSEILQKPENTKLALESTFSSSAGLILKAAMVFAAIFAIVTPLITSMSFTVSIHRALTIILIATPMSVVVSMPLVGRVGLCYGAQFGVVFNSARTMEKTNGAKFAVFDKSGVLTDEYPRLMSVQSDVLDSGTFMTFAAHACYYSEQPFAKAVSAAFTQDYKLSLISDFMDIPGCGVDLTIGGAHVTLATRELFISRGVSVPFEDTGDSQAYYMTVSDRYVGYVLVSEQVHQGVETIVPELKTAGIEKCVLLAEEGKEETEKLAFDLDFDESFGECDSEKKLKLIDDLNKSTKDKFLYIYSSVFEAHSSAAIDMQVGKKSEFADAVIDPGYVANLPNALRVCNRMRQVAVENAIFAFCIKALLIFLSIIGFCNIWFAVFIDMVAAVATILNTIRVTCNSLIKPR